MTYTDAKMGDFYQEYPTINLNTLINYSLSRPLEYHQDITIVQDVQFPDVSFYQGPIDYSRMNVPAIILRIGQNIWKDEQFERNYAEAKAKGLLVGGYWFYDDRRSPQEQAEIILESMQGKTFELELYIDWENSYGGAHGNISNVVALMELIEHAGLRIKGVGLYSGYYWFVGHSNPVTHATQYAYLQKHPLWLAWYTTTPSIVKVPPPWTNLTLWQWGTPVINLGQATLEIDMNWFSGTKQEFESRYGQATGEEPPMADYVELKSNTTVGRSIRQQTNYPTVPHIIGSSIKSLPAGRIAKALIDDKYTYAQNVYYNGILSARTGDIWWKVYEVDGVPTVGWIAEKHKGEILLTVTPRVTPIPTEKVITHALVYYDDGSTVRLVPE